MPVPNTCLDSAVEKAVDVGVPVLVVAAGPADIGGQQSDTSVRAVSLMSSHCPVRLPCGEASTKDDLTVHAKPSCRMQTAKRAGWPRVFCSNVTEAKFCFLWDAGARLWSVGVYYQGDEVDHTPKPG